jgi:hypothetical protein
VPAEALALPQYKAYGSARLDVPPPGVLAGIPHAGRLAAKVVANKTAGGTVFVAADGGFQFTPAGGAAKGGFDVVVTDAHGANSTRAVAITICACAGVFGDGGAEGREFV